MSTEADATTPNVRRVAVMLRGALGEDVVVHGVWETAVGAAKVAYAVFSFPAHRVSGLEHWRDTVELVADDGVSLVADEAGKTARLLLRAESGTRAILSRTPSDADEHGAELFQLASSDAGDDSQRFERLNEWLRCIRTVAHEPESR